MFLRDPPPIRSGNSGTRRYAHQRVMRLIHATIGKKHFVSRDQRQVMGIGHID